MHAIKTYQAKTKPDAEEPFEARVSFTRISGNVFLLTSKSCPDLPRRVKMGREAFLAQLGELQEHALGYPGQHQPVKAVAKTAWTCGHGAGGSDLAL